MLKTQEEQEEFNKAMALAEEIMRTDRELFLKLQEFDTRKRNDSSNEHNEE